MFEKIKQFFKTKMAGGVVGATSAPSQLPSYNQELSYITHGFGSLAVADRLGSYDNTYDAVSRIAEAVAEILPIAVNEKGEEVDGGHLLEVLRFPNREMSGPDFMEHLATLMLVHPKVYLRLVYAENAPQTLENLTGLLFMENVAEMVIDGHSTYRSGGKEYSENEVITLSMSVNPYHLLQGYSPSVAAKKWATIDDYIAEYQAAQFRNGAVPAGQFVITAPTTEAFNSIAEKMEHHFRGAHNSGNIMYVHRPTSDITGQAQPAQIEWVPFAQTNKELTLDAIYKQANTKIDNIFGVPEEIKGHLSNSTYASAEVADYVFSRRVVYPKLVKIYAKLTHEFNRVFGGLGFALSFHYEMPMLTDTRKIMAEALAVLLDCGFTVESAIAALQLPPSFGELEMAERSLK